MRIIGGTLKGRTLYGFRGEDIRPTSDSARESLFNILGDVTGADFLDLFCGTGAVGIEAQSRGAKAVFNDNNKGSVTLTRANLKKAGIEGRVTCLDALSFIKTCGEKFDIIFLDPPYKSEIIPELLNSVNSILKDGGKVVYENEKIFSGVAKGLVLTDVRRYGRAVLHFFDKQSDGVAVYAGTFDPVTKGHEKSVMQAVESFNKVYLVVGENAAKSPCFTEEERAILLKATFSDDRVEILKFSDFKSEKDYAEFLEKNNAKYYVRGIRNEEDFAYEKKAERKNTATYPFITTAYIFCEKELKEISSTKVKTVIKKGGDATLYIPESARGIFAEIMRKKATKE